MPNDFDECPYCAFSLSGKEFTEHWETNCPENEDNLRGDFLDYKQVQRRGTLTLSQEVREEAELEIGELVGVRAENGTVEVVPIRPQRT